MTLIIKAVDEMLYLPKLLRLALKKIYEIDKFTFSEERTLHKSIIHWNQYLRMKEEKGIAQVDIDNQIALEIIASLLYSDEKGEFDKRKQMFKEKNIDYRKFHKLPEAYEEKDFLEAQHHAEEHKRTNPEDYE